MKNFVQPGDVQTCIAPVGGVVSGLVYKIGAALVVATTTAAAAAEFEGLIRGVVEVPKATGAAWTDKQIIYWDDTAKNFTGTVGTNRIAGWASVAAASAAAVGTVFLDGVAR